MSKDNGWIKIHRDIINWEWYDDSTTLVVFLQILLKANHKEKNYRGKTIERGQFVTSQLKISEQLGLSRNAIRRALKNLEVTNEITIDSSSQGIVIQVVNYEKYQGDTNEITNERNNKRNTVEDIKRPTTKKAKKEKKEKKSEQAPDEPVTTEKESIENILSPSKRNNQNRAIAMKKLLDKLYEKYPDHKIGNKKYVLRVWMKFTKEDVQTAIDNVERYLLAVDNKFVHKLENYLSERCFSYEWLDAKEKSNESFKKAPSGVDTINIPERNDYNLDKF